MKPETYKALKKDLQTLQKSLVAKQIDAARRDPCVAARMARAHAEAEVGGSVDDFVAGAARKSTVLLLLRTVFVRVLEDLGILGLKRLRDDWGLAAFREVAPALRFRAYLGFVFRDLAVDFPALFAAADDELPLPDEDACEAIWRLWHHPNRNGDRYEWNEDGFDSRFLGDLYEDLDEDIRKRYALLQTPRYVEEYILDHTLTPALAEFDPGKLRSLGDTFRVLDPTCGSGHFLIGAFHRLANYWRDRDGLAEWDACSYALESVYGCDINPHAVEIAQFRLLLEVVARTGIKNLERLAGLKIHLRVMDSLIPWERVTTQADLFPARDRLDGYATTKERRDNAEFLAHEFHVVVGNPPYITPKDVRKRDDYRLFWPASCHMEYVLSVPFVERWFDLAKTTRGFVGQITSDSLTSRGYGKKLINQVLHSWNLTHVIDSSGVPITGVPTIMFFGTGTQPKSDSLRVVACLRGQRRTAGGAENGPVWRALVKATDGASEPGVVEASNRVRRTFLHWPLILAGADIDTLRAFIAGRTTVTLGSRASLGTGINTGENQAFEARLGELPRVPPTEKLRVFVGEDLKDWTGIASSQIPWAPPGATLTESSPVYRAMWPLRTFLDNRKLFSVRCVERGIPFWSVREFYDNKYAHPFHITHPLLSTHPHFVVQPGSARELHSAPLIVPNASTLDDALDLVGLLNSSTITFWLKGILRNKGSSGIGGGSKSEAWERFFEFDATKLAMVPITELHVADRIALARSLQASAQERAACLPRAVLASDDWLPARLAGALSAAHEQYLAATRRMVALQEELDWLTYSSYGLLDSVSNVAPEAVEPLSGGHRPFELVLARKDETSEDEKSVWWSRHGYDRATDVPTSYSGAQRDRLQERVTLIESDPRLALLETPAFKRRWQLVDWVAETKSAAEGWLLDRLEALFAPGSDVTGEGPLAEPKPYRLEDITAAWSRDPRVAAVAGVWTGTGLSVDLALVAEKLLRANALPDNPHRLYSEEGLRKLAEWKHLWARQDGEDVCGRESAAALPVVAPPARQLTEPVLLSQGREPVPLPRKFDKDDFLNPEVFSIRGTLNVPRERFIVFADLEPNRFGWNGWRDRNRALAQVEAFTLAEGDPHAPVPVPTSETPRRCGVTFGLWESLPDVRRWGAADEHAELSALAREACRQPRCPCPVVEVWKSTVLRGIPTEAELRSTTPESETGHENVSLAQRAWVVSLFRPGKELDLAGVWARHVGRMTEPQQGSLPGLRNAPVQLSMPTLNDGHAEEHASLDQLQLALVVDDLVASGDLQVAGRGTKKRFQLVSRGGT